jgi:hypothetical protein
MSPFEGDLRLNSAMMPLASGLERADFSERHFRSKNLLSSKSLIGYTAFRAATS